MAVGTFVVVKNKQTVAVKIRKIEFFLEKGWNGSENKKKP